MKYRLGILTSLYDDYAVDLLKTIDKSLDNGMIDAEVPFIFCNRKEDFSAEFSRRVKKVRELKHLKNIIFLSAKDFKPQMREQAKQESEAQGGDLELMSRWRMEYDRKMLDLIEEADSILSIGYMQITGPEVVKLIDIVNIHPAVPEIGPIGMWPKVMEKQAERPLPYLLTVENPQLQEYIPRIMNISQNKAGGMLHLLSEETDRGPVIAWYEFPLTSPRLDQLWVKLVEELRTKKLEDVKKGKVWEELAGRDGQIRHEQFKGETPLILLTYRNLTWGDWEIRNKRLYAAGRKQPNGYCLNREIGECLSERGVESLIS